MSNGRRLALWIAALLVFFGLTALCLPCVPCPPEAQDCCGPRWVTPKEWPRLKITYGP